MVDSINKNGQGVLLHSILTAELAHGQSSAQTTRTASSSPTTTNIEGRCGTFPLPIVARALGSMSNNMPFIFIPSVTGSKTSVSLMRSSLASSESQAPVSVNSEIVIESGTVPHSEAASSAPANDLSVGFPSC